MSTYYILYEPNRFTDGHDSIDSTTGLAVYAGPVLDEDFARMLMATCESSHQTEPILVEVGR